MKHIVRPSSNEKDTEKQIFKKRIDSVMMDTCVKEIGKPKVVLSAYSIHFLVLMLFALVFWSWGSYIATNGQPPESLDVLRNNVLVANWGEVAEMDYDVLMDRMLGSAEKKDGNSFLKTMEKEPNVMRPLVTKSIDELKNNTCVVLTPTKGENSPYGFCKHDGTYSAVVWVRVKFAGELLSESWGTHMLVTPHVEYMKSLNGGRVHVDIEKLTLAEKTKDGRSLVISGCGVAEHSTCVEETPEDCVVQVHFMKLRSNYLFHRDRYYWCPAIEEFIGLDMHRHRFGYFNRVFTDVFIDLPGADLELVNGEIYVYRDNGVALETAGQTGKMLIYFQLLIIILPIWFVSMHCKQRTASDHPATATFMDLCYRLSSIGIIFVQILYFSYDDLFLIAYGIAHFRTLSWGTFFVILRAVVNTLLVIIIGANTVLKYSNANCRYDAINKNVQFGITLLILLLTIVMSTYYATPSLEKGTLCDFKYSSICENGGTCCSESFTFSAGHIVLYATAILFLISYVLVAKHVRNSSTTIDRPCENCFEEHCLDSSIEMVIQDYKKDQGSVQIDGFKMTSALAVSWVGFIGVVDLGLIRVKDIYLILIAKYGRTRALKSMNVSVVVWMSNHEFNPYRIDRAQRFYLMQIRSILLKPLQFYINDIGYSPAPKSNKCTCGQRVSISAMG